MRGRKPKPSTVRHLDGNPGKRPFNAAEPHPPAPSAEWDTPPAELTGDEFARGEWARLAPMLRRARQVTEADRAALVALCLEWSRYIDATRRVQRLGPVIKAPSGYPMLNPYLSVANKALQGCNRLWPELGLTPSSRTRVRAEGAAGSDGDFAEFLDDGPVSTARH